MAITGTEELVLEAPQTYETLQSFLRMTANHSGRYTEGCDQAKLSAAESQLLMRLADKSIVPTIQLSRADCKAALVVIGCLEGSHG